MVKKMSTSEVPAIALCDPSLRALRDDRAEGISVLSRV